MRRILALIAFVLITFVVWKYTTAERWEMLYSENFDSIKMINNWIEDTQFPHVRDDGKYGDRGDFFLSKNLKIPKIYRIRQTFGKDGWLTIESATRDSRKKISDLVSVQDHTLQIRSPLYTDGTVIRSTNPLPQKYRICVSVGNANYGDGKKGMNGYKGKSRGEPWRTFDSTQENGFYWLAILDDLPRPRNNVWIHHHRKVVIDSDNNQEAWTKIWNGKEFLTSGEHPVMMFGLDPTGKVDDFVGLPFLSYSAGKTNSSKETWEYRAADAYKEGTWYRACITRREHEYELTTEGDFKFGGLTKYLFRIPFENVYHSDVHAWPEYFMFGDPHINFYEGSVSYRELTLEIPVK